MKVVALGWLDLKMDIWCDFAQDSRCYAFDWLHMRTIQGRVVFVSAVLMALLLMLQTWRSDGFRGVVTDSDGNAVEGAVVVCAWIFNGWHSTYYLSILEGETDSSGEFVIDSWARILPVFGGYLSRIDYFVVQENFVPLYRSTQQVAASGSIDVSPIARPEFSLLSKASVDEGDMRRKLHEFENKLCFLASRREIDSFVGGANLFTLEINKLVNKNPDLGLNVRACGF